MGLGFARALIPVEEDIIHRVIMDIDGDGVEEVLEAKGFRPPAGGLSIADIDGDGHYELVIPPSSPRKLTRTVYKSILELLLGS